MQYKGIATRYENASALVRSHAVVGRRCDLVDMNVNRT
jgi:hypothetical protein